MMRIAFSTVLIAALSLNACGSDKASPNDAATGTDGGTDAGTDVPVSVKVTVSGTAAPHALTAMLGPAEFSSMVVAVVNPETVLFNPTAPPLAGGPLDTSAGNCTAAGCAWSFDNVDIGAITLGLVGILDDGRTTGKLWIKTGTGAGSGDFINMIKANPVPITGRPLFAVSKDTEKSLVMFANAFLAGSAFAAGDLEARGFMLGTIVKITGGVPAPVGGAMVAPMSPTVASTIDILYPSNDFTANGNSTAAAHGTFIMIPKTAAPKVSPWVVTPPAGSADTWPTLTAGSTPGTAFVLLFAAN